MSSSTSTIEQLIEAVPIKKTALLLRAINHPLRQQILQHLHLNLRMTVTQIFIKFRIEQSVASQHLALLRKAGLVYTKKEGKCVFYSVNYNRLNEFNYHSNQLLKTSAPTHKKDASK
jgi:DNA-binding transcriptional ArsR family regulator